MLGRDEKNKQNIIQCGIFVCFIENDQYTSTHSLFIITDSVEFGQMQLTAYVDAYITIRINLQLFTIASFVVN